MIPQWPQVVEYAEKKIADVKNNLLVVQGSETVAMLQGQAQAYQDIIDLKKQLEDRDNDKMKISDD